MATDKYMPTRVGMLLLDTENGYVWTVKSKTRLVRTSRGIDIEATLTKGAVPPDWKVIDGDVLAGFLLEVAKPGAPLGGQDLSFLLTDPVP